MQISRLFLGNSNAYLVVCGSESAIIDGGLGNKSARIVAEMARVGADPAGLKYIAVTHAHYDHVGSIKQLKADFPHALIVAQQIEADNLRAGLSPVPAGTMWFSRPISLLGCKIFHHCIKFKGFSADLVFADQLLTTLGNEELEFFHTPGHTNGSMCVRVGRHAVFVGDTVFHVLPGNLYPPFADIPSLLPSAWQRILDTGCRVFYPGHGRPIPLRLMQSGFANYFSV